jgi:hypothetical protein
MVLSTVDVPRASWPGETQLAEAKQRMTELVPALTETTGDARRLLNAQFSALSEAIEQMRVERARWLSTRGNMSGAPR